MCSLLHFLSPSTTLSTAYTEGSDGRKMRLTSILSDLSVHCLYYISILLIGIISKVLVLVATDIFFHLLKKISKGFEQKFACYFFLSQTIGRLPIYSQKGGAGHTQSIPLEDPIF